MTPPAIIRTFVPSVVGAIFAFLTTHHISIDSEPVRESLTLGLTGILGTAYYAIISFFQTRWPLAGILLGSTARPIYAGRHRKASPPPEDTAAVRQLR